MIFKHHRPLRIALAKKATLLKFISPSLSSHSQLLIPTQENSERPSQLQSSSWGQQRMALQFNFSLCPILLPSHPFGSPISILNECPAHCFFKQKAFLACKLYENRQQARFGPWLQLANPCSTATFMNYVSSGSLSISLCYVTPISKVKIFKLNMLTLSH